MAEPEPGDVTRLIGALRDGDDAAFEPLMDRVHGELRSLAARHLARERPDHTLQPTALVSEVYLKLVDQRARDWESREHFLSIASTAMRRILLQHARAKLAEKRGGAKSAQVTLFDAPSPFEETPEELVALDDALGRLESVDPMGARIVELRFFGGLSVEETATLVDVPLRSVERSWRAARAWLRGAVSDALAP